MVSISTITKLPILLGEYMETDVQKLINAGCIPNCSLAYNGNIEDNTGKFITPYVQVSSGTYIVWQPTHASNRECHMIEYNSSREMVDYWSMNVDGSRTIGLSSNTAFVRATFLIGDMNSARITNESSGAVIWSL